MLLDKIEGNLRKRKMSTLFIFNLNCGLQEGGKEVAQEKAEYYFSGLLTSGSNISDD